jgi:hypothetical protein
MNYRTCILSDLTEDLSVKLRSYGFQRAKEEDDTSGRKYHHKHWKRIGNWRTDYMELLHPVGGRTDVIFQRTVCIDIPGRDRENSWLESQGFLHEELWPRYYWRMFANNFRKRVVYKVIAELPWFDRYSTPARCLEELNSGRTNHGDTRGPTVLAVEKRLRELIESEGSNAR